MHMPAVYLLLIIKKGIRIVPKEGTTGSPFSYEVTSLENPWDCVGLDLNKKGRKEIRIRSQSITPVSGHIEDPLTCLFLVRHSGSGPVAGLARLM